MRGLASLAGFVTGIAAGFIGVGGGEFRIPVLTDRRLGGIPNAVLPIAMVMGIASAVGVVMGAALIPNASRDIIKGVLGVVLLLSAIRLTPKTGP